MPVEIRELVITTSVEEATNSASTATSGGANQEDIIMACVEKVLEILKEKTER